MSGRPTPLLASAGRGIWPVTQYIEATGLQFNLKLHRALRLRSDQSEWLKQGLDAKDEAWTLPWFDNPAPRQRTHTWRRRKMAKKNTNISGVVWHDGRRAIDRLREDYGLSWTQVSRAIDKDPGWARTAYDNKHSMHERDVQDLGEVLRELDEEVEKEKSGDRTLEALSKARVERAGEIVEELRNDPFNLTWDEIAVAFGYASGSSAHRTLHSQKSDPGPDRIKSAEAFLHELRSSPRSYEGEDWVEEAVEEERENVEPEPDAGFGWMKNVQADLLRVAERVEDEARKVPPAFRGPYQEISGRITSLAAELDT